MHAYDVTTEFLVDIPYQLQSPYRGATIAGVRCRELEPIIDGRGDITVYWSRAWPAEEGWVEPAHIYHSVTDYGVVKCWHLHDHHTDQFVVTRGKLQVTLVDIRPESPTFGHVNTMFPGHQRPQLITIPPMIMHGWKALSMPEVLVVNLQSHIFDPTDEFKFPWDCVLIEVWDPRNG